MATDGEQPPGNDAGEDPLREQALDRLRRKRKFRNDVLTYLFLNAILWGIWALTGAEVPEDGVPWPVWVSGIWGVFVVLDAIRLYSDHGITDSEVEAEMRRIQDRR
jgi:hypothetical protein